MRNKHLPVGTLDPHCPALGALSTPALVVDVEALERNIAAMAKFAHSADILLRPHVKTHKSSQIAQRQMDAGAVGIACATVAELEHFIGRGFRDILLTSAFADGRKAKIVAELACRADLSVVVDHIVQVDLLNDAMAACGGHLRVFVDIDVGQNRCGVADIESCLAVARSIEDAKNLVFAGLQGFAGQAQHIVRMPERQRAAADVAAYLRACAKRLDTEGIEVDYVTGSGTGTSAYDVSGPFAELQVGSYVFMDADYGRVEGKDTRGLGFENSLFILATVVSVNRQGQVTIDAGSKAFAINGPTPKLIVGAPHGTEYRFAGDEHGILLLPDGATAPSLGSRVLVEATHCDPTANLYAGYSALHPNGELERWDIGGRYA